MVRQPVAGARIQVIFLGLLLAAAAALPGVQRAAQAGRRGLAPRRVEPAIAVHQQPAGDVGQPAGQRWKDEQLVPEDVAAIGLAMQAARRHADIAVE